MIWNLCSLPFLKPPAACDPDDEAPETALVPVRSLLCSSTANNLPTSADIGRVCCPPSRRLARGE